ncbi:MAG: bacteriohemerythrin [Bryobacteraceae bacterium]|jgi:hemerythrin
MPKFQWKERYAVHVAAVDDEHQMLFQLCASLESALTAGVSAGRVRSLTEDLIRHAAEHFSHEEREMRAAGYAHYAWHRRRHKTALRKVSELRARIRRGDREAADELLRFLQGWLNDHIGIADRMLGAFLRNQQRAREAQAS